MMIPVKTAQWVASRFYGKGLGKYPFLVELQRVILDLLTPKYRVTTINGYKLKVGLKMGGIGWSILRHEYEPMTTLVFKNILRKLTHTSCVVDVGANIGYYTLLAAKEGFKTYAIEPNPEAFKLLVENCKLNDVWGATALYVWGVTALWGAAWDIDCTRPLGVCKEAGACSLVNLDKVNPGHKPEYDVMVNCIRLDSIPMDNVGLVKIDVEGAELNVLRGMRSLLQLGIPYLLVECWSAGLKANGDSVEELLDFLRGYDLSLIDEHRSKIRKEVTTDDVMAYYQAYNDGAMILAEKRR